MEPYITTALNMKHSSYLRHCVEIIHIKLENTTNQNTSPTAVSHIKFLGEKRWQAQMGRGCIYTYNWKQEFVPSTLLKNISVFLRLSGKEQLKVFTWILNICVSHFPGTHSINHPYKTLPGFQCAALKITIFIFERISFHFWCVHLSVIMTDYALHTKGQMISNSICK